MNKTKTKILAMLLVGMLCVGFAQAQESVNSSGGSVNGSGGNINYSIGQLVYTTHSGSTGSIAQGVQHAYKISTVGLKVIKLNISLVAFPNPTSGNLTLQISNFENEELFYQLYDINGKQLGRGKVITWQTQINTLSLPPGSYTINILNHENKKIQSFKIIKN